MKAACYLVLFSFIIFVNPLWGQLSVTISGSPPSCGGADDGIAIAQTSGGVPPYTFMWNTGQNTPAIFGLSAGFYQVTVTDQINQTGSAFVNYTEPPVLSLSVIETSYCDGTGDVAASAQGGAPNYFFTWSNGVNTPTQQGLPAGTYTVTVYDQNGCNESSSVTLADTMTVVVNTTEVSCNEACDATVSALVTGGTPPYTYAWNVGATTQVIQAMHINTYIVTVTDANGCIQTGIGVVTGPDALALSFDADTLECGSGAIATATVSPSGGTPPYFIYWSNGQFGPDASGLAGDSTYYVTVYDINSCEVIDSLTITTLSTLDATLTTSPDFCDVAGPNGNAIALPSGGTPPYSYLWSTGATSGSIFNLLEGEYTVTVSDANGCSVVLSDTVFTITLNMDVGITAGNETACAALDGFAQAIPIGGNPPYTYLWSNGATTQTITGLGAGIYTVVVSDASGCIAMGTAQINGNSTLETTLLVTQPGCTGLGSITVTPLNGSPPFSYAWNTGDTTQTIQNLPAGNYGVTTTSSEGCIAQDSVSLFDVQGPDVTISSASPGCGGTNNGSAAGIVGGGTPPYSYLWSTGETTETISNLGPGDYFLTVTDSNNCSEVDSVSLTGLPEIICSITLTDVSCFGAMDGSANASVSGGTPPYQLTWNTGDTTASISALNPGTYILTVEDAAGCAKMDTVTIAEPAELSLTTTAVDLSCDGLEDGEVSVTVSGGTPPYFVLWNTGDITDTVTGLGAGIYSVTATDASGCSQSDTVEIVAPGLLNLDVSSADITCFGENNGSAEATLSGGVMPYNYAWSNGETTAQISGLSAGDYTVTATDTEGCFIVDTVSINEPAQLTIIVDAVNPCEGDTNGSISLEVSGGVAPYTINWEDGTMGPILDMVGPGDYSVTVTDANGCQDISTVGLSAAESPVLIIVTTMNTCAGGNTGSATVEASGGTPPYIIGWSNGVMGTTATDLAPGDYTVVVMDANGCTDQLLVNIGEDDPDLCSAYIISEISAFGGSDGSVGVDPPTVGGNYTYEWNTGSTDQVLTDLPAGLYQVTITNTDNGCLSICEVELLDPAKVGDFVWDDLNENGIQDPDEPGVAGITVKLNGTADNGDPVNLTTVTNGSGSYLFDGLPGGTYTLTFSNLPIEYGFTIPNAGFNDALDSDAGMNGSTATFELILGTCVLDFDAGIVSVCENFTDPGEIAGDEYLCGPGNDPSPIIEIVPPSGGSGAIEYLWMFSQNDGPFDPNTWILIPNSNTPNYDPGPIAVTTYYARCVRREDCVIFLESSIVVKEVGEEAVAVINGPATVCVGDLVTFTADNGGNGATYAWNFGPNASPSTATTQVVDVEWNSFGVVNVQLTVINNGCTALDQKLISISDSPIICPPASGPIAPVMSSTPVDDGSAQVKAEKAAPFDAVQLFPNPAHDLLQVRLGQPALGVYLYTIQGERVRSLVAATGSTSLEVSVHGLPADTYLVQIQYLNGSSWSGKVVVQ